MFTKKFDNQDIAKFDWATLDRVALLRSLHSKKSSRPRGSASSEWGADVAGHDLRSVHAYLAGKGDLRALWWNIYSRVFLALMRAAISSAQCTRTISFTMR